MFCRKYNALIVETAIWPISFLINVFTALKGSQFYFSFVCFNICHIGIKIFMSQETDANSNYNNYMFV